LRTNAIRTHLRSTGIFRCDISVMQESTNPSAEKL
jgi:hypothetical protein